jgi:asparagine synthase (glutamine-hydrolysing)
MCGIAGIFSREHIDQAELQTMTGLLAHRGPDAHGVFTNSSHTIGLGHTRLCILDLSASANQPFYSSDGRYVVVFNGEIFNYNKIKDELVTTFDTRFRTTSDTEVIAEGFSRWGTELVKRLEGMFAFAVVDLKTGRLFLVRDRVGKKPLYYTYHHGKLFFASEIKALTAVPSLRSTLTVNRKSIASFLHLGFIPEPSTIYLNIKKFPAGCVGEIFPGTELNITRYWSIEERMSANSISENVESTLHALLENSVSTRLISDVPVGTFLSGGTDSSLVTAIASKAVSKQLKTFSIAFRESKFDERKYAEGVSTHLKTDHTSYELSETDALDLVEAYLTHFDEPFADTSAIPTMLVSKLARKEVTVALTGDGGDELFQGYGSYAWARRLDNPLWKMGKLPLKVLFDMTGNNRFRRISDLLEPVKYGGIRSHIFSQEQYFFSQQEVIDELLVSGGPSFIFDYHDPAGLEQRFNPQELQALFDFNYYLKDDLLVKVDMASMYYALECRCPLLDHNVVEFAAALDFSFKVRNGQTKWILKEILRKYLPDELVYRHKWGFSIPLAKWLKGDLRYLIDNYLNESVVNSASLVNYGYVDEMKKKFFGGRDYLYNRLWLLIVLHRWWARHHAK